MEIYIFVQHFQSDFLTKGKGNKKLALQKNPFSE
jgi:hypothetical protein